MADTYSIGSLSDLITGSNTPNKPKVVKEKFKVTPGKLEHQNEQNVEKSPEKSPKILKANNTPNKLIGKTNKRKSVESSSLGSLKKWKSSDTSLNDYNDSINESVDKRKAKKRKSLKLKSTPCKENEEIIPVKKPKKEYSDDQSEDEYVMSHKKTENVSDSDNQSEEDDTIQPNEAGNDSDDKPELRTEFQKNAERRIKNKNKEEQHVEDPEQTARTVYVGNVPLLAKNSEMKKFFSKYGKVEAVRFRGIAVEDPKISKKIAYIKQRFHKDRKSCAAYVRFVNEESAQKALQANGAVFKEHHLTVDKSKAEKKPDESRAIFIGNVSFSAEEEDLWKLFETCGPIESVRLIRDNRTGVGKGFGYINFKTSDAVQLALEMGEVKYKDRVLRISLCNINAAKKNKKLNKVKKISKPGKPKVKSFKKDKKVKVTPTNDDTTTKGKPKVKSFKKDKKVKVTPTYDDTTTKEKTDVTGPFQGSKVTQKKKKKNKPNKGLLEKKKMIRKLAPQMKQGKE